MRTMRALLSTEATKLKHTATLWLSPIVPVTMLVLLFIGLLNQYFQQHGPGIPPSTQDMWNNILRGPWTLWTLVAIAHPDCRWKQPASLVRNTPASIGRSFFRCPSRGGVSSRRRPSCARC